ncbi:thiamine pyrophosphate-requiring protein [Paracoccus onubensis]|uniref:thiamine pyrophosphate-requiring protein n=1 Tax=Paracoccus onubensis TaxID=1675788 RepID=UPI0027310D83|nr:thiamine pyrophosphate-requiring protein [Paracoccus onubensis]MDP0926961.1 thiamine pyrophosphate-requiring protein [Paracoccus onubensis]
MATTVGDIFWQRLKDWGVSRVFGYPGDGINGLLGALQRRDGDIEFVQVRHEEMAAFMATAHAKFTGELGVCLATSGPGASHLLTGLYDARMDHMPVLAIAGQQARTALGSHYQQEIDLVSMFKDVAGYVQQVALPSQTRHLTDRALRIAIAKRQVAALIFPNDLQETEYEDPPRMHGSVFSGGGYSHPRTVPHPEDLSRAADVLNDGKRVAMLVGAGALQASAEIRAVAETLGAGVAKALLGKAVLPDDLPYVTGSIGLLGTEASWDLMSGCDTLLLVGTGFPYSEFLPEEGAARAVQIDIDPSMLSLRYPAEVNLAGDSAETLRELLPLLRPRKPGAWQRRVERSVQKSWKTLKERAYQPADPVNPQLPFWELSARLPDNAILTSDSGSCANWFARDVRMRDGMMASLSGGLASMGAAVPYAIAAKFAHPDRAVVAMIGDGAMQMNNMAELITVAKYWQDWSSPTWICLVLNNQDLNQVTWEQRVMEGNPKFEATQTIPDIPYHRFADLIGLKGILVDDPDKVGSAWDEAFAASRPVVIELRSDPEVPPMPPHLTFRQLRNFAAATISDTERAGILRNTARQVLGRSGNGH